MALGAAYSDAAPHTHKMFMSEVKHYWLLHH